MYLKTEYQALYEYYWTVNLTLNLVRNSRNSSYFYPKLKYIKINILET